MSMHHVLFLFRTAKDSMYICCLFKSHRRILGVTSVVALVVFVDFRSGPDLVT